MGAADGPARFEKEFEVRATDLDVNLHLTSPAYLEYAIHTRMSSLGELGLLPLLEAEDVVPVVLRDDIRYRRELRVLERVNVSVELAALSRDGSRWRLLHEFVRVDGTLCATVRTDGAWFHLKTRKITVPSADVSREFARLHRTDDFELLPDRPASA